MGNISYWKYEQLSLHRASSQTWAFVRAHYLWGILVMILTTVIHIVSLLPAPFDKLISQFDVSFVWGLLAVVVIIVIVFLVNLALTPYRIYKDQQVQFEEKNRHAQAELEERDRQIVELIHRIEGLRGQKCDMDGSQVLEYMAKHSGLETKREIESALATAAAKGLIHVEAMASTTDRVLPVEPEIFKTHTVILEPESDELKKRFGFDPKSAKMGGRISTDINRAYAVYHLPMFYKSEIELYWPPKE